MAKSTVPIHFLLQCRDPEKLYNYSNDMAIFKTHYQTFCMGLPIERFHRYTESWSGGKDSWDEKTCVLTEFHPLLWFRRETMSSTFCSLLMKISWKYLSSDMLLRGEALKAFGRSCKTISGESFKAAESWPLPLVTQLKLKLAITFSNERVLEFWECRAVFIKLKKKKGGKRKEMTSGD